MKKFLSIFSIALVAMFAMGCGNDEPTDGGKESLTFEITESAIDSSSIEVMITPSDATVNYIAGIAASAELEGKSDATIIDEWVSSGEYKTRKGMSFLNKGGLMDKTAYTVVVFAITETEKVTRKEFTTTEAVAALPADQFNITIDVKDITATSAVVTVTPNGTNRYYFRVIPKLELDAWEIYGNDYETFSYICENPNSGKYITSGTQTQTWTIHPEMDYIAIAFNYENWKDVYEKVENVKLFTYEFKTPEAPAVDPNTLFTTANLKTYNTAFSLDVTPARGEDAHWTYYVWTKTSYDETLANEPKNNIVMRSCFGLNNIAVAQGYDFGTIIQTDKLGKVGSNTITSYETLRPNTDYVVVLFYVDPTNSDPTEIYDYNFVAVDFKTVEASGAAPVLEVSEPIIESSGFAGYSIKFNIKVDDATVSLSKGANIWSDSTFGKYWDPSDWNSIRAFCWLYPVNDETLAQAKTDVGCVISFTTEGADDYVIFFEAENAEGTRTQHVVRVTPDMYTNVQ